MQYIPLTDSQASFYLPTASKAELEVAVWLGAAQPASGRRSLYVAAGGLLQKPQDCHLSTATARLHSPTAGGGTAAPNDARRPRNELTALHGSGNGQPAAARTAQPSGFCAAPDASHLRCTTASALGSISPS